MPDPHTKRRSWPQPLAALGGDADSALGALRAARAAAREQVWQLRPPVEPGGPLVIDLDATIVLAHSEKEGATPTWKRTFGFHPLLAFLDHGPCGTGEYVGGLLRTGKATANDAADHIAVLTDALAQLPAEQRARVLVRGDSGAGVQKFVWHLHQLGLHYSVGLYAHQPIVDALAVLPRQAWRAAIEADGQPREGAQVAELTRYLRPSRSPWPAGMRVIARRERPHPGAQLRLTDADGWRITLFATNVTGGRITEHELLHRQRARAEDRIRCIKDTGLRNPARLHRQPDLARTRRARTRSDRLDPAPRARRQPGTDLGTQAAAPATAQHRRPHRPQRTPRTPAPSTRLALGQRPAGRPRPARRAHTLTNATATRSRKPRQTRHPPLPCSGIQR